MSTEAQKSRIYAALKRGEKLTPIEALDKFNCFRLAARIQELREDGNKIHTLIVERGGRRVAQYSLLAS